jgi:hypothetical protein
VAGLTTQTLEADVSMLGWAANVEIAINAAQNQYAKLNSDA